MKALWLEGGALSVRDVDMPVAGDEALIRVRLSGVCGTDLELVRGYHPFTGIPGHEFVGDVIEAPDPIWVGRRIVGEINVGCGVCEMCCAGLANHCREPGVLGIEARQGVHAEYVTLPVANLHQVPDNVSDEAAVFTEPLAAAIEILEQVRIEPTDRVLLVGAGRLGQMVARVLAHTGAQLSVVARHEHQRRLLEMCGIATLAEDQIEDGAWDIAVEATGNPSGLEVARQALRPRGTLVLKSTYHGDVTLDMAPFVVHELTIVGSRCGPFAPALALLEGGHIDPTPLITGRFSLDRAVEAMQAAARPGAMKVLIDPLAVDR